MSILPGDPELWNEFRLAFAEGLAFVESRVTKDRYISTHSHWVDLRWNKNGMPSWSERFLDGPKNYASVFDNGLVSALSGEKDETLNFQSLIAFVAHSDSVPQ